MSQQDDLPLHAKPKRALLQTEPEADAQVRFIKGIAAVLGTASPWICRLHSARHIDSPPMNNETSLLLAPELGEGIPETCLAKADTGPQKQQALH